MYTCGVLRISSLICTPIHVLCVPNKCVVCVTILCKAQLMLILTHLVGILARASISIVWYLIQERANLSDTSPMNLSDCCYCWESEVHLPNCQSALTSCVVQRACNSSPISLQCCYVCIYTVQYCTDVFTVASSSSGCLVTHPHTKACSSDSEEWHQWPISSCVDRSETTRLTHEKPSPTHRSPVSRHTLQETIHSVVCDTRVCTCMYNVHVCVCVCVCPVLCTCMYDVCMYTCLGMLGWV